MPRSPVGRPMKYDVLIRALNEEGLYSPASIAHFAEENGFLKSDPDHKSERRLEKQRIRIAMGRLSNNHDFPDEGDDILKIHGQSPVPAWYGWRWKAVLG